MEELQSLLRKYYLEHAEVISLAPWNRQYCRNSFPKYWEITFSLLQNIDKDSRVIEIGCGLGAITSILCYQGYEKNASFEKDSLLAEKARLLVKDVFEREDIIINQEFPSGKSYHCDVLILVNCVYANLLRTKMEYLELLRYYYESAHTPRYFILEVIDDSYQIEDAEFPSYIRLNEKEVRELFSDCIIKSWVTYHYPENQKSKKLYLIVNV